MYDSSCWQQVGGVQMIVLIDGAFNNALDEIG